MNFKIGLGTDIHQLKEGRDLWLGGVKIDYKKGLLGHSDADVVIHSIADAILGALGLGDIGEWFPDSDPQYKDLVGKDLLAVVMEELSVQGGQIGNLDVIVFAEEPKLASHKSEIKKALSNILALPEAQINIKAKTNEKLDSIGQGLAISCTTIVLIQFP